MIYEYVCVTIIYKTTKFSNVRHLVLLFTRYLFQETKKIILQGYSVGSLTEHKCYSSLHEMGQKLYIYGTLKKCN